MDSAVCHTPVKATTAADGGHVTLGDVCALAERRGAGNVKRRIGKSGLKVDQRGEER